MSRPLLVVASVIGLIGLIGPTAAAADPPRPIARDIYLDRCRGGCLLTPGPDDAIADTSSVVDRAVVLSEFAHGDAVWNDTVTCLRDVFAPYDVVVSDLAPPPGVVHHQAIIAGSAAELGVAAGIKGLAPSVCRVRDNAISFTLAHAHDPDAASLCWTAAQEIAHSFGLEHVVDCREPMSYIGGCGPKFFRNEPMPCGDWSILPGCYCSEDTHQSSHQWLRQVLGASADPPRPTIAILSPDDGATLGGDPVVIVDADDRRGVTTVTLAINGRIVVEQAGAVGTVELPPTNVSDGILDLTITATNEIGLTTTATRTVVKGAPCTSDAACTGIDETCEAGRCMPPPLGQLGDGCVADLDCAGGLCARSGDQGLCTAWCDASSPCPGGFACEATLISEGVCWPLPSDGCAATPPSSAPIAAALGLLVLALRPRRRRP